MLFTSRIRLFFVCLLLTAVAGCASAPKTPAPSVNKYSGDEYALMPDYTPRDDGLPLTSDELYAFRTISDLDKDLDEESARIVELHFKFFVHQNRGTFERILGRSSRFLPHVKKIFAERGIPEDIAYLFMIESGGNPVIYSRAGATGLWQFMPFTGKKFGLNQNNWVDERRDPFKATYAASDYLLKLYGDFNNWHLAVAAYNAGEGKIGRAVNGTQASDFFELCRLDCQLEEKLRLKPETRDYVPRLIAVAKIMRNLNRLGFAYPQEDMVWDLEPVNVPPGTNLAGLAKELDLRWDVFSGMNPAFKRTASPPTGTTVAYLPPEKTAAAAGWMSGPDARAYTDWKEYTIKRGDTLASIAKRNGISVAALRNANNFSKLPNRGTEILIPGRRTSAPVLEAHTAKQSSSSHIVVAGDTIYNLATRYGTTTQALLDANMLDLKKPVIRPGEKLFIPGQTPDATVKTAARSKEDSKAGGKTGSKTRAKSGDKPEVKSGDTVPAHTIKAGDTLYSIALANNTSVKKLMKANGIGGNTKLQIGQKLVLR